MKDPILHLLSRPDYVPADAGELLRKLRLIPGRRAELNQALADLEQSGRIARIKGNRFALPQAADLIPGRIRMNRQGKGFVVPDDPGIPEITVPEGSCGTALHEDRVLIRLDRSPATHRRPGGGGPTGTVLRVLERRRTRLVGTLQRSARFSFVVPDDPRIPHDIYVPEPRDVGRAARVGDKVVVELKEWISRNANPEGEVVEVLGPPDAEGVDMLSVLRQYDLPLRFPPEVLDEARAIGTNVQPADLAGRKDCRNHLVVTIDPDDAKDFDDAIGLEPLPQGTWRLRVHIADVSHYVKPGTALDAEARRRGNSTYLVDRVIPMLPEALSNELCSLKPQVDRLTKCVEFRISSDGRVLESTAYPAVIHSRRRFTYREVLEVLGRAPSGPVEEMLHQAHGLAQKIRRRRFDAGALELDFPEMKIRLDDSGRVDRIERIENDVSHQLIEEFMLLANEAVAAKLIQGGRPTIHRVHESPEERRLAEYREEVLAHRVPCGNLTRRPEIQKLLRHLGTLELGPALKIGFLKSLMRARYAVESLGHYGLAKKHYTHFTSPIRRYSDLVVHRSLFERVPAKTGDMRDVAEHLSTTERNSADAERDSKDVKLFSHLEAQLASDQPQRYGALVTDVRNFGFFVDVTELAMSGLVPLSALTDDFYQFDPDRLQLVGRRTRRVIRLGARLEVQVARVDRTKKQVDFRLAGAVRPRTAGRTTPHGGPQRKPSGTPVRTGGRGPATASAGRNRGPARPLPKRPGNLQSPPGGRSSRRGSSGRGGTAARPGPQRPQSPRHRRGGQFRRPGSGQ
ncbi:MAG: ribonuclease R [Verrucomicrobiales bacterium]|nr:ribonuclease R [Verrucomicrobiales bacterium]